MRSRRFSTRCRAKARKRGGRPCSAASPAAICGRAASRTARRAICNFCDTDFVGIDGDGGGQVRDAGASPRPAAALWRGNRGAPPFVVLTGGEPHAAGRRGADRRAARSGLQIAIETNGTLPVPRAIDWICVSPKAGAPLVQRSGDELKLVYPQAGARPAALERPGTSPISSAADGRRADDRGHMRAWPSPIASPTPNGA